jgi:hypothetical protein
MAVRHFGALEKKGWALRNRFPVAPFLHGVAPVV